ncbi:tryptophan-rich sensory protein [Sporosarcina contaminans]|uniref:Tryptophan-rich sensory protein n=1 Tax=Sporosarcina contaminans TaxID=633403 RepID=A0ABW3TXU5_9BACL
MSRIIMMTLSLLVLIILHVIATFFSLNGQTTSEIANRLPLLFIPANYVFLLWIVIYAMLFVWIPSFAKEQKFINLRMYGFFTAIALSIVWIFCWHYGYLSLSIAAKILLLCILFSVYFSYHKTDNRISGRMPYSLLIGWNFLTLISTVSYYLLLHDWSGFGLSAPLWTVIYLTISTAFALHFMFHYHDFMMNFVFIWTFIGIAFKNGTDELFVTAAALFLTAVLIAFMIFRENHSKKRAVLSK